MGNIVSAEGDSLATVAIAHYVNLTKEQVLHIRDVLDDSVNSDGHIRRRFFHIAVAKAKISIDPDGDILDSLFTMWDLTGKESVPANDFCVGFSVLACAGESLMDVIRFAMEVQDVENTELITADQLMSLLKSIVMTASYFGDRVMGLKTIYRIVDNVFDTLTIVSQTSERMTRQECLVLLMEEPLIVKMIDKSFSFGHYRSPPARVTFVEEQDEKPFVITRLEDESQLSTDVSSVLLTPLYKRNHQDNFSNREKSDNSSIRDKSILVSSSNSSLALVPVAHLRVDAV